MSKLFHLLLPPSCSPAFPVSICNVSSHPYPPILLLFHMDCVHSVLISCQCWNWFQLFLSLFLNIDFITSILTSFSPSIFLLLLFCFLFFLSMFYCSFFLLFTVSFIINTCVSNSHISSLFLTLLSQCCTNSLHFFCPSFYTLFII